MTFYRNFWWSVLPFEAVAWMVDYIDDNPAYLDVFRGYVAEEAFITTTLMRSPFAGSLTFDSEGRSHSLTFTRPLENNHPPVLTDEDIKEALDSGLFFARKVDWEAHPGFCDAFLAITTGR